MDENNDIDLKLIKTPEGFEKIAKGFVTAVLRHKPCDIYKFGAEYFENLQATEQEIRVQKSNDVITAEYQLYRNEIPSQVRKLRAIRSPAPLQIDDIHTFSERKARSRRRQRRSEKKIRNNVEEIRSNIDREAMVQVNNPPMESQNEMKIISTWETADEISNGNRNEELPCKPEKVADETNEALNTPLREKKVSVSNHSTEIQDIVRTDNTDVTQIIHRIPWKYSTEDGTEPPKKPKRRLCRRKTETDLDGFKIMEGISLISSSEAVVPKTAHVTNTNPFLFPTDVERSEEDHRSSKSDISQSTSAEVVADLEEKCSEDVGDNQRIENDGEEKDGESMEEEEPNSKSESYEENYRKFQESIENENGRSSISQTKISTESLYSKPVAYVYAMPSSPQSSCSDQKIKVEVQVEGGANEDEQENYPGMEEDKKAISELCRSINEVEVKNEENVDQPCDVIEDRPTEVQDVDDASPMLDEPETVAEESNELVPETSREEETTSGGESIVREEEKKPIADDRYSTLENSAASTIQATYKGYKARKEFKKTKSMIVMEVDPPKSDERVADDEGTVAGATIQDNDNGCEASELLENEMHEKETDKILEMETKSDQESVGSNPERLNEAATTIQAGYRGYKTRKVLRAKKKVDEDQSQISMESDHVTEDRAQGAEEEEPETVLIGDELDEDNSYKESESIVDEILPQDASDVVSDGRGNSEKEPKTELISDPTAEQNPDTNKEDEINIEEPGGDEITMVVDAPMVESAVVAEEKPEAELNASENIDEEPTASEGEAMKDEGDVAEVTAIDTENQEKGSIEEPEQEVESELIITESMRENDKESEKGETDDANVELEDRRKSLLEEAEVELVENDSVKENSASIDMVGTEDEERNEPNDAEILAVDASVVIRTETEIDSIVNESVEEKSAATTIEGTSGECELRQHELNGEPNPQKQNSVEEPEVVGGKSDEESSALNETQKEDYIELEAKHEELDVAEEMAIDELNLEEKEPEVEFLSEEKEELNGAPVNQEQSKFGDMQTEPLQDESEKLNSAAIVIQEAYKKYRTKNEQSSNIVSDDRGSGVVEEPEVELKDDDSEMEISAATLIQAAYRGYRTRKDLESRLKASMIGDEGINEQSTTVVDAPEIVPEGFEERRNSAATIIQATYKGYKTRKVLGSRKETSASREVGDTGASNGNETSDQATKFLESLSDLSRRSSQVLMDTYETTDVDENVFFDVVKKIATEESEDPEERDVDTTPVNGNPHHSNDPSATDRNVEPDSTDEKSDDLGMGVVEEPVESDGRASSDEENLYTVSYEITKDTRTPDGRGSIISEIIEISELKSKSSRSDAEKGADVNEDASTNGMIDGAQKEHKQEGRISEMDGEELVSDKSSGDEIRIDTMNFIGADESSSGLNLEVNSADGFQNAPEDNRGPSDGKAETRNIDGSGIEDGQMKEEDAATRIQAAVRGFLTRRRFSQSAQDGRESEDCCGVVVTRDISTGANEGDDDELELKIDGELRQNDVVGGATGENVTSFDEPGMVDGSFELPPAPELAASSSGYVDEWQHKDSISLGATDVSAPAPPVLHPSPSTRRVKIMQHKPYQFRRPDSTPEQTFDLGNARKIAATKIQAGFRGFMIRKQMKTKPYQFRRPKVSPEQSTEGSQASSIGRGQELAPKRAKSANARMYQFNSPSSPIETGKDGRRSKESTSGTSNDVDQDKDAFHSSYYSKMDLDKAATKIQASFRGYKTRTGIKRRYEE